MLLIWTLIHYYITTITLLHTIAEDVRKYNSKDFLTVDKKNLRQGSITKTRPAGMQCVIWTLEGMVNLIYNNHTKIILNMELIFHDFTSTVKTIFWASRTASLSRKWLKSSPLKEFKCFVNKLRESFHKNWSYVLLIDLINLWKRICSIIQIKMD